MNNGVLIGFLWVSAICSRTHHNVIKQPTVPSLCDDIHVMVSHVGQMVINSCLFVLGVEDYYCSQGMIHHCHGNKLTIPEAAGSGYPYEEDRAHRAEEIKMESASDHEEAKKSLHWSTI